MQISKNGLALIEKFEGFVPHRYQDSVGVWTIGYGTTNAVISPLPYSCTQAQAEGWLKLACERDIGPMIQRVLPHGNQNQIDALFSVGYNLGAGIFQPGSQLGNLLLAGDYRGFAHALLDYDHAGGRVLPGLAERRQEEADLFLKPIMVVVGKDPKHYLWFTPEERAQVKWYDMLRDDAPKKHRARLAVLRAQLRAKAAKIYVAAHKTRKPDWKTNRRGWRYQQLIRRANGARVA